MKKTLNEEKERILQIMKFIHEGVGDTYADKRFYTSPSFSDFEYRFKKEQSAENKEEIIYIDEENKLAVIKNPKSIGHIGPNVRGIIDKNGNLYIEMQRALMHADIANGLEDLGMIDTIRISSPPTEYIAIQRYGSKNEIYLSEATPDMYPDNMRPNEWSNLSSYEKSFPVYQNFLNKAKQKNPKFNFINKVIKYLDLNGDLDYEDTDYDQE